MQKMPQSKNAFIPRKGQQALIKYLPRIKPKDQLPVQWPTGYGKSMGFALTWKHCKESGIATHLLMVVANDTQRRQIENDFAVDCSLVNAPCKGGVWSFDREATAIRVLREGSVEVFVTTVHQVHSSMVGGGVNTLKDLLIEPGTKWMIGFDEYQHLGEDMEWGNAAQLASEHANFVMAMSATPYRRKVDTIFNEPELKVTYTDAVKHKAVKPIVCHSYDYRVTVVDGDDVQNYTTSELMDFAPNGLDTWEERKSIRYSAQYIHPLITNPLNRLGQKRAETGLKLQMIIRAMSCNHADVVCKQVETFAGNLKVDWIGTGYNGKSDAENRKIIEAFCPPKDQNGKRPDPSLDILVQVNMAGEGFDSINVAEIVDLFPVSNKAINGRATQDKQFYGRGSRIIKGAEEIKLHVNIPTDHPLNRWGGRELHAWMDASGDELKEVDPKDSKQEREFDLFDWPDLPKEREIELLDITVDHPHYQSFKASCRLEPALRKFGDDFFMTKYLGCAHNQAREDSEKARIMQSREYIEQSVGRLAFIMAKQSNEVSGADIGRYKRCINSGLKKKFGKSRDEMTSQELIEASEYLKVEIVSRKPA